MPASTLGATPGPGHTAGTSASPHPASTAIVAITINALPISEPPFVAISDRRLNAPHLTLSRTANSRAAAHENGTG